MKARELIKLTGPIGYVENAISYLLGLKKKGLNLLSNDVKIYKKIMDSNKPSNDILLHLYVTLNVNFICYT